jgi:hypothetical protein
MSFSIQNWLNCPNVNSPPLWDLKYFNLCYVWTFSITLCSLIFLNISLLCLIKFAKVHLEWCSRNVTRCYDPPKKFVCIRLHKSKCINFNNWVDLLPLFLQFHDYYHLQKNTNFLGQTSKYVMNQFLFGVIYWITSKSRYHKLLTICWANSATMNNLVFTTLFVLTYFSFFNSFCIAIFYVRIKFLMKETFPFLWIIRHLFIILRL